MILQTSATMALLLAVGWLARRSGRLKETTMRDLSALVVDVAFPALVLVQLPRTVDAATLAARWYVPVLGAAAIATSLAVGHLVSRIGGAEAVRRRTLAFLVGTPNWIFFPLPIAERLYGAEGVQSVLLLNVGAQLVFWTLGVLTLRGRMSRADAARGLLRNPGLWATLAGAGLALVQWRLPDGVFGVFAHATVDAAALLGSLAVPLSFLVAGMQFRLGEGRETGTAPARREMVALLLGRLVLAPAVFIALVLALAPALGVPRDAVPVQVACLVAVMPVAVTCGPLAERLGGDTHLAARAIVFSTLVALVSVPGTMALVGGLWPAVHFQTRVVAEFRSCCPPDGCRSPLGRPGAQARSDREPFCRSPPVQCAQRPRRRVAVSPGRRALACLGCRRAGGPRGLPTRGLAVPCSCAPSPRRIS